jgi:hypothetical protein
LGKDNWTVDRLIRSPQLAPDNGRKNRNEQQKRYMTWMDHLAPSNNAMMTDPSNMDQQTGIVKGFARSVVPQFVV